MSENSWKKPMILDATNSSCMTCHITEACFPQHKHSALLKKLGIQKTSKYILKI